MTYKPRFYWDEETMVAIKNHVYNDCTPDGDETYHDLYVDLEYQVIEAIEKDDNRKL